MKCFYDVDTHINSLADRGCERQGIQLSRTVSWNKHLPVDRSQRAVTEMLTTVLSSSVLRLLLLGCLAVVATGRNVSLQPSDELVDVGSWASFNCTLPCDHMETHTINWFIGDSPISRRIVYLTQNGHAEEEFEELTGMEIELQDTSTCGTSTSDEEVARQQLRVFVNSTMVQRINRTAVQCAALRKNPSSTDLYSYYGVIMVNGDLETPTIPTCTSENRPTQSEPESTQSESTQPESTQLPMIEPSISSCFQQTVTVTQTVTDMGLVPTQLPTPTDLSTNINGSLKRTASLILTLSLVSFLLLL